MRFPRVLCLLAWPWVAFAQTPAAIGEFRDWKAYTVQLDNQLVCYLTTPAKSADDPLSADHLIVSRRPTDNVTHEVNLVAQRQYQEASTVEVTVDPRTRPQRFALFTEESNAWAENDEMDRRLVEAMRAGSELVAEGRDVQGRTVQQRYSLLGFTAAFEAVTRRCPLP